jgi:hypothetical protein
MGYWRWTLTFFSRCFIITEGVNMAHALPQGEFAFVSRGNYPMSDPVFQQAFETVRKSWSNEAWGTLTPRQVTELIYREIRRIDAGTLSREARPAAEATPAQNAG